MPAAAIPDIGSVLVGRYQLTQEIGRGGCAVVFEARDHRLNRVVAIKLPIAVAGDSAKLSRFAREARVIASIQHPNVCAVLDSGYMEDGTPFLVMERLFGESLRSTVNRVGRLEVREAIAVGLQLLCALDSVHTAGVVHRDVKPDNIILVARPGCDSLVKLLDFGLCRRAITRRQDEETMTCEGAIVGTPEYMAPEQVLGSTSLDVRVDVYAVGVVLYEALTGQRAFFSKNLRDILSGVMHKKIPPLRLLRSDVPVSLEAIVAKAMHRNPTQRHSSAAELQDDLNRVRTEIARRSMRRPTPTNSWDLPTRRIVRRPPPITRAPETLTPLARH
jgi:serine/threonine-protein kinase